MFNRKYFLMIFNAFNLEIIFIWTTLFFFYFDKLKLPDHAVLGFDLNG